MPTRDHRVFLLTAYAMFYSFAYGSMRPDANSVFDDPAMLIRMAVPALAGLFALYLRNRWAARSGDRPQYAPALDLGVAFAFVLISQWTLAIVRPAWMLPRWIPSQGALVGWWFIAILRALLRPGKSMKAILTQRTTGAAGYERSSRRPRLFFSVPRHRTALGALPRARSVV